LDGWTPKTLKRFRANGNTISWSTIARV
jgi:hypothetical protein